MFEEALRDWEGGCLTQDQAAALLGVSPRTFRRWVVRYGEDGIEGLRDRRVSRASHRAAPVDEVMRMVDRYRTRHVCYVAVSVFPGSGYCSISHIASFLVGYGGQLIHGHTN